MQTDSPFEGTIPKTASPIFIHMYLYSRALRLADISSERICHSAARVAIRPGSRDELPALQTASGKVSHHFTQQRMSPPPPHARQSVCENLHNSGRKCQYTESMIWRMLG